MKINENMLENVSYLFVEVDSQPGVFLYKMNKAAIPYFTDKNLVKVGKIELLDEDIEIIEREIRANIWSEALVIKKQLNKLLETIDMDYYELERTEQEFRNKIKEVVDSINKPSFTLLKGE